jgi:hypothetical protein
MDTFLDSLTSAASLFRNPKHFAELMFSRRHFQVRTASLVRIIAALEKSVGWRSVPRSRQGSSPVPFAAQQFFQSEVDCGIRKRIHL